MKEQLITFETAKIAKEKGFNIKTRKCFSERKEHTLFNSRKNEDTIFEFIPARSMSTNYLDENEVLIAYRPTQSLLQKWLREEHSLHMEIFLSDNSPYTGYYYRVMTIGQYFTTSHDGILSDKFEYALEKGLQEALKII